MTTDRTRRGRRTGQSSKATVKDVADAAGVSMMTVSNVVHGRSNVGAKSRERILKVINKLGYVPNRAAQELAGASPPRFGLLYPSVRNAFIASVFVGALTAAARLRAEVSIQLAEIDDSAALRKILQDMEKTGIEGFLLPSPIAEFAATALKHSPLKSPAVAIAPGFTIDGMVSVRCDERQAAFELVSMLADLGHTKIGHIAGPEAQTGSVARYEGYRAALQARGLAFDVKDVVQSAFIFQDGIRAADQLLHQSPHISAVFAANDTLAASVLAVAHGRGIEMPRQLSVVGYDNSPIAEQVWPPLTTVRQDATAMTERAVEILFDRVNKLRRGVPDLVADDTIFPYEIIRRSSISERH